MSRLGELINELCPNGVEYRAFGDIAKIQRGASPRPISNYITDKEDGIPWIKIGDTVPNSKYVSKTEQKITSEGASKSRILKKGDFIISNSMSFGRPYILNIDGAIHDGWASISDFENTLNSDFLYHFLSSDLVQNYWISKINSGSVSNLNSDIIKTLQIPLPPLPVQEEIVRILDNFTELTTELITELTMELTARKKQYEYYRDSLFTFDNGKFEWKMLGDIGEVRMCKRILKEQTLDKGDIPFYKIGTFGKEANAYISRELFNEYKSKYNYPKAGEVLISASGTIGRSVIFDGHDAYFQDSNIVWIENNETCVLNKYLFYFYKIAKWYIAEGGTIQRLYNENLKKTNIPIPYPHDVEKSFAEQQRIIDILDRFDTLCNDILSGLPAEIKARQQQYEYYRDKLLTFSKAEIEA